MSKSKSSLLVKGKAVFYLIIWIVVVSVVVAAAFYFDEPVKQWMLNHQSPGAHGFMENVSRFGDWPEHVLIGLSFMAIAQWRGNKKWTRIIVAALIALSIAGLTGRILKISTGRARPSVKSEQAWNGLRVSGSKYHSFPSGHVDASVGFFGVLFLARRRVGLPCLAIPILIAFSRLYLGAHWLSDVVCAAILGIVSAVIVWHFIRPAVEDASKKPAD